MQLSFESISATSVEIGEGFRFMRHYFAAEIIYYEKFDESQTDLTLCLHFLIDYLRM